MQMIPLCLYISTDNLNTLFNHIDQELILVAAWFYDNRLSINSAKTNYLLFILNQLRITII